jgi:hypothetical protein
MRRVVVATITLGAALVLGACGGSSDDAVIDPTVDLAPSTASPEPGASEPGASEPGVSELAASEAGASEAAVTVSSATVASAPVSATESPTLSPTLSPAEIAELESQLDDIDDLLEVVEIDLAQD